ncbi:MAG TPA: hypothetical protein VNI20_00840, partial [Fimbriimonadaceae bacterium]|nr:hypothetical protein [Fimbriimonadaceae bacterium]
MFCTLVLGAALLQQQTITFTHPCANSAVVLEALGKRLGVTMRPSGSVTKDYFLVSFHDITKEEALDKIASALNATWEEKNDVTYLTRTHNQELAEKDAVHKQEVQAIQEWLDKNKVTDDFTLDKAKGMLEQLLPLAPYPGSYDEVRLNKFDEIEKSSPINRYALRLAAEIGAEAIAQTYLSDPIVFTQNPTGSQRQFPNGPATRLFEEETATLKEALRQTKTVEKWPEDGRDSNFVTPFSGVKEFTFGPKDLRITIRNYGLG